MRIYAVLGKGFCHAQSFISKLQYCGRNNRLVERLLGDDVDETGYKIFKSLKRISKLHKISSRSSIT